MAQASTSLSHAPARFLSPRGGWLAAALTAAAGLLTPAAAAQAATRTGSSEATGMRATLTGSQLTISPGPEVSSTFLHTVQGRTVTVACVSGAQALTEMVAEDSLVPTGAFDFGFLGGPALWPSAATSLSYSLPRDVSEQADGCIVGRDADLGATFGFTPVAAALLEEGLPVQRLALAHRAAKRVARAREDRRFPSPRRLARAIASAEPQMKVAYARDLRRARGNHVVYVIGAGTSFKRVQLAHRENDGQPVVLEARRRGAPEVEEPGFEMPVPDLTGDERRRRAAR